MGRFTSYEQFQREVLQRRAGPMTSAVEDMADELFHNSIQEEFDSLWDSADDNDE